MQDEATELTGGPDAGGSARKGLELLAQYCDLAIVTLGELLVVLLMHSRLACNSTCSLCVQTSLCIILLPSGYIFYLVYNSNEVELVFHKRSS